MIADEFSEAVKSKNLLMIRIMLKDSLLIDKSFSMFNEMGSYAENKGIDFWMEQTEELEVSPGPWTVDQMNYELVALVNSFTKERLSYVKAIIKSIYGSYQAPETDNNWRKGSRNNVNMQDYRTILKCADSINRLAYKIRKEKNWFNDDISRIKREADKISRACKNIEERRKWH